MRTEPNFEALVSLFDHQLYLCEAKIKKAETQGKKTEEVPEETTIEQTVEPISYLGENKKEILMIFEGESMSKWPKEWKHTFLKILQSIKLDFNDIACLGIQDMKDLSIKSISTQIPFKQMFLWGVNSNSIGLEAELFTVVKQDGFELICLPDISSIQDQVTLKRKVWDCIKHLNLG
jgi:hypothetical protein